MRRKQNVTVNITTKKELALAEWLMLTNTPFRLKGEYQTKSSFCVVGISGVWTSYTPAIQGAVNLKDISK